MITHSSGNFVETNIHNHHLYTLQICMICVAVISMLSSIVAQKPLIAHLRMRYAWKYHSKKQFRNEILLHFVTRWRYKDERKTGYMPWITESLFRLWDICKTWTTPIFPPRGLITQYFYSNHVQDWCSSNFSTIQLSFHYSHRFPRLI